MTLRTRVAAFVVIALICLGAAGGYVWKISQRSYEVAAVAPPSPIEWRETPPPNEPGIYFRSTLSDRSFGRVAFVPVSALSGPRYLTPISCDRLYVRGGIGACLLVEHKTPTEPYQAFLFDRQFSLGPAIRLSGLPSRTRVSPDGRLAAITVFEAGHSYAEGGFSTRTTIIDTAASQTIADLEQFEVRKEGMPFKAVDFNFWGVTFTPDSRQFYATLGTGGAIYLIRGEIATRTATVIHQGVECPSLSPDGRRIAFKKRITGPFGIGWGLAIFDLASRQEIALTAETHSVDDQVDWLDDEHVLYHNTEEGGAGIWALKTDNSDPPQLLLPGGYSPSVVR